MDVPHRLGAQSFGLLFGLQPIYPAFGQQFLVELLQFQRGELFQRDVPDIWIDVVVDVAPVSLVGGGSDFELVVVLKPYPSTPLQYTSQLYSDPEIGFP